MKVAGCIKWKRIAALAILVTFFCPATAHLEGIATQYNDENNILWPKSPLYDHAVNDADVRDVLTQIISTAGFRYVFKPGVRGTITYKFRSIALGSAFDRIIELSGLQYSYDPYSQTITILPALEQAEELIELNRVDPRAVKQAAVRLDIGEIKADTQRRVVYIRGSLKQVQALRDLVQTLENKEKSNLAEVVTLSKINADEVKSAVCLRGRPPSVAVLTRGRFAALQAVSFAALQGTVLWRGLRSFQALSVGAGGVPIRNGRLSRLPSHRARW